MKESSTVLSGQKKESVNLKMSELRLYCLKCQKKKEWVIITEPHRCVKQHQTYQHIMRVPEEEGRKGWENIWKNEVEKFPNLMKMVIPSINCMNSCPTAFVKSSRTKNYDMPIYHAYYNGKDICVHYLIKSTIS